MIAQMWSSDTGDQHVVIISFTETETQLRRRVSQTTSFHIDDINADISKSAGGRQSVLTQLVCNNNRRFNVLIKPIKHILLTFLQHNNDNKPQNAN